MRRQGPIYRRIADELRQRVASGRYESVGLPSELKLMKQFKVSRHTIRSAIQCLVQDGLIKRRAGSGTRVTGQGKAGVWVIGSLSELLGGFTPDQYLTLSAGAEPARLFPNAAALFGMRKSSSIYHMLRVLRFENSRYALSHIFAPVDCVAAVPPSQIGSKPLVQLVQDYTGMRVARTLQVTSAEAANEETALQIEIPLGSPVLVVKRTYFDSAQRPFLHTELYFRSDRYQQILSFVHIANSEKSA